LRAGESCALVGVGSSGKSNVARHIARADVRLHYLGEAAAHTAVVYLNCKPLAPRPPHELYLEALDQLERALGELGSAYAAARAGAASRWREAQSHPDRLARRGLDLAVAGAWHAGLKHALFVLDDCDDLFGQAPPVLFSELRALRDNHKLIWAYLTLSRREPAFLRPATREFEELFELFSAPGHTLPVPPYREADGLHMIRRLASRQREAPPAVLAEADVRRLYELGGGHGGLMRSLFFAARGGALGPTFDSAALAADADVADECRKIWDSLEPEEQADLRRLIAQQPATPDGLRRLERRGLVRPGLDLFSPVFARFLVQEAGLALRESLSVEFVESDRLVRVGGRPIGGLSPAEFEILRCLARARPGPCSRLRLIEAMRLGERSGLSEAVSGDPLRRLEQHVQRLAARLGPAGRLILAEADGYRLAA
jgi:hypothetical protein